MPVRVLINSRVGIARELGMGVQLPEGSDIAAARKELGTDALIGASCHSMEAARAAEQAGASFVLAGPVFSPISKSATSPPLGLAAISEISKTISIPVVAIGGITPKNAKSCVDAGAQAVASIGALLSAADPRLPLLDFMRALGRL